MAEHPGYDSTPLKNKEEIMEYTGLKKSALKNAIEQAGLPVFYIGGKMQSNTAAINEWYYTMSIGRAILVSTVDTEDEDN